MRSIFRNSFFSSLLLPCTHPLTLLNVHRMNNREKNVGKYQKLLGLFFLFLLFLSHNFFFSFRYRLSVDSADSGFFPFFFYGISLTLAPQDDVGSWGRHTRRLVKVATRISLHTFSLAHSAQIAIIYLTTLDEMDEKEEKNKKSEKWKC